MTIPFRFFVILFIVLIAEDAFAQSSQDRSVPQSELKMIIDSTCKVLISSYISEDIGIQMANRIQAQYQSSVYDNLNISELADSMKSDFRDISNDVHMNAFYSEYKDSPESSKVEVLLNERGAFSNYGFVETKITRENIGYLKIAHFTSWDYFEQAKIAATNAVKMIQHTDALLIDLRDNGGGFEDIVAYLISHFVEGSNKLQSYNCRYLNYSRSVYLTEKLPMQKLPDLPIYILINENTGSAAESFAYIMKHLGRAKLIGNTTVGAGNGSTYFRISSDLRIQVSTWETINEISKTSWEKTGVVPHIEVDSAQIYEEAYQLAIATAKDKRAAKRKALENAYDEFNDYLRQPADDINEDKMVISVENCVRLGLYNQSNINDLGYQYLAQRHTQKHALILFKSNIRLFPDFPNVYDSYAEALEKNGDLKAALENYEKAVLLGIEKKDPDLSIFQENLNKLKVKLE